MLSPADFFDLTDFEHRALFEGAEYVWDGLRNLEAYIGRVLKPGVDGTVMEGAWVGEDVFIGKGTVVEPGAMIKGPTIIGENCEIRQVCYIRGNVIVGNDAVVGHCTELKGVVMLNKAKAPHFNYVGDSILGYNINLGAGSICSNLKVTWEPVVVKVEGREYETGLLKLGAILGDDAETGCNTVLNPGTLLGKRTLTYPCSSLRGYFPPDSIIKMRQTTETAERRPSTTSQRE
jgi:NDP-sugar pyrophosphorylase family protein